MKAARSFGMAMSAWALVAAPLPSNAAEDKPALAVRSASIRHLRIDDTLGTLLDTPAFAGFAPLLLPWNGRGYDRGMKLTAISSLMPFHSQVDPAGAVAALNRMIDDTEAGKPVFYDIYTKEQKQADPTKAHTGLFFFRGELGAPLAVISPGGGFSYVGSLHEGFPYAVALNAEGYNAFVLRYRPGVGERAATEDLAAAISYIDRNAKALGVDIAGYSLWGSSAGARMAANIGSHGTVAYGGNALPAPAAVIMAYTAHADRAETEPPTFAVVGEQDGIAPYVVDGAAHRRPAPSRHAGRVPCLPRLRTRFRPRCRHGCPRLDPGSHKVLESAHRSARTRRWGP
jgi:acetyl esterase/lipase